MTYKPRVGDVWLYPKSGDRPHTPQQYGVITNITPLHFVWLTKDYYFFEPFRRGEPYSDKFLMTWFSTTCDLVVRGKE